jgi:hypothetical protein
MMLIIEIHVDTIEESKPSTPNAADGRPKRVNKKSKNTGNRFWNTIRFSSHGSLIHKENNKNEG